MNSAALIAAAFPALLIVGVLLAPLLARRDRSRRARNDYLGLSEARGQGAALGTTESRLAVEEAGDNPPAEGDQYFADWAALQAKFVD